MILMAPFLLSASTLLAEDTSAPAPDATPVPQAASTDTPTIPPPTPTAPTAPLTPVATSTPDVVVPETNAVYRSGQAPLTEKARVKIGCASGSCQFIPVVPGKDSPWSVKLIGIRGAQSSPKGFWFYWFDEAGATLHAAFEANASEAQNFISAINAAVIQANKKPMTDEESQKLKANYEEYQKKALQQSR